MTETIAPATPAPRTGRSGYVVFWVLLAGAALVYIGWAAKQRIAEIRASKANIASTLDASSETASAGSSIPRPPAEAGPEVKALQEDLTAVQRDVAQLKADVAATNARGDLLASRVTALETPIAKTSSLTPEAAPGAPAKVSEINAADAKPADTKAAGAKPAGSNAAEPAAPKVLNAPGKKPLETGSVAGAGAAGAAATAAAKAPNATEEVVFGPPVVKPAPKPVGILIATGPSLDAIRLSWTLLAERHGDILKSLDPRYVALTGEQSGTFDLVAGPVKSVAEARKICSALEAKLVPCKVSDYTGDAL